MILDAPLTGTTLARMLRTTMIQALSVLSLVLAVQACGPREEQSAPSGETSGSETSQGGANDQGGETGGGETGGSEAGGGEASGGQIVVGTDPCTTDADCVPADCCHAAACVARANAPSCGDAMCTMECRAGTTDCGGGCLCQEGRCAARLMVMEEPQVQ